MIVYIVLEVPDKDDYGATTEVKGVFRDEDTAERMKKRYKAQDDRRFGFNSYHVQAEPLR